MRETIKTVVFNKIIGCGLNNIDSDEFLLVLLFAPDIRLEIREYWECFDEQRRLIDRYLSAKLRKKFRLSELVGKTLIDVEIAPKSISLIFSNQWKLEVLLDPESPLSGYDYFSAERSYSK